MIQHYNDKALKLFILIESSNMFHWKPAKKKIKVVVVLGENLGEIRSNVVKKVKKKKKQALLVKIGKKIIFNPVTLLSTQFSLKTKLFTAIVS